MKFKYRVKDKTGKTRRGVLDGDNRSLVVENLLGQGFYILELTEVKSTGLSAEINLAFLERVPARELASFTRQLATMIGAGLSILRSFTILGQQTKNKTLKKAILKIRDDLEAGSALYEAMNQHPRIFSRMYVSMVRAGELGGILDQVLERLAEHIEREQEITSKVKSASVYPAVVSVVALMIVFFILTFIMPTFTAMFMQAGVELPAPTRILLGAGVFIKSQWYLILGLLLLIFLALRQGGKTASGRLFLDSLYLRLPLIGETISKIIVARFARTMGTLIQSGIPVLQALEAVEEVVGNEVVARAIRKAKTSVRDGEGIARPFMETRIFDPMIIQMMAVGEETGTLDDMLVKVANYFEKEVMYLINTLMSLLEPLLIMVVALLVGGIIIATLLPLFDMVNVVGKGM